MSHDRLRQPEELVVLLSVLTGGPGAPLKTTREWLEGRAKDTEFVDAARKRLVEYGISREAVEKLPALQIVLLDEKRWYETDHDEVAKWFGLPFWMGDAALQARREQRDQWLFSRLDNGFNIVQLRARLDQKIALLRHVEAIRMYAAEHGKLPSQLSDVSVPLPPDPFTGKPFLYEVDGRKAILRGTPPRGLEKRADFNVQYEVTLRP
jgi:hypothetical protein